jgi:hypothetical protein
MNWKPKSLLWALGGAMVIAAPGCEKTDVKAYKAPKDAPPPRLATNSGMPVPAAVASPGETDVKVTWTAPGTWTSVVSEQPMRIATYRAGGEPGVEVVVSAFPGDVGGTLANVNRWRGQVGAAPVAESDLAGMVESVEVEGVKISTLRIKGERQDMLAAMITPGDGQTWFVKATGEAAALDGIGMEFVAFARTFRVSRGAGSGAAASTASASPKPAPAPASPAAAPSASGAAPAGGIESRLARWTSPTTWTKEANASGFLTAAYIATNGNGGARITVSNLAGEGGGLLNNINRWRGQVGLAPVASLDQQATSAIGAATVVDLADAEGKTRMIMAVLPAGEKTWYYKLTGTPSGVDDERAAFEKFVRTTGLGEP